ncbi:hypothetical protein ACT17S_01755 [Glutamicibacter mysorens]
MNTRKFAFENVELEYKTRPAKKDIEHLIVMFSGIRPDKGYEFDGQASSSIHCNWLWIRDEIEGEHTYYLSHKSDTTVQRAVLSLIESELERLGLGKDQCTFVGFSKGGAAAIALGLKGNYPNIVATVPQIAIGDYVRDTRPAIMKNMLAEDDIDGVSNLNSLIPSLVEKDENTDKNVYIWSSLGDKEFATQVEPFLPIFGKYSNFNTVITDSPLVTTHNEVTKYNLSNLVAVLNLLIIGIKPRLGNVRNGIPLAVVEGGVEEGYAGPVTGVQAVTHELTLKEDKLFPSGIMFLPGVPLTGYNQIFKDLILTSANIQKVFRLAEMKDKWVNQRYFAHKFVDYRFAGFASRKNAGIDLSELADGFYSLSLRARSGDRVESAPMIANNTAQQTSSANGSMYILHSGSKGTTLLKRSVMGESASRHVLTVEDSWIKSGLFHVEGRFAVQGIEAQSWKDLDYFLVLKSSNRTLSFKIGAAGKKVNGSIFANSYVSYKAAYFATPGFRGVPLADVPTDTYEVNVSLVKGRSVFTERIGQIDVLNGRKATGVFKPF